MAVGALEPQFYTALVTGLGLADELPPARQLDFSTWPAQREAFTRVFATRTRDEWATHFEATDACVAPVLGLIEAPGHPQLVHRETFTTLDGVTQPRVAPRFSRTPGRDPSPGHTDTAAALAAWGITDIEGEEHV